MAENPTFQIPKDVIEPIIQAHITEAVIRALGGQDDLVKRAVSFAMNVQVDRDGKPTSYNGQSWIVWAMGESLRKAAKFAIEEHLAKNGEIIKQQLAKELRSSKSVLAKQLIESMVGNMTREDNIRYRLTVTAEDK